MRDEVKGVDDVLAQRNSSVRPCSHLDQKGRYCSRCGKDLTKVSVPDCLDAIEFSAKALLHAATQPVEPIDYETFRILTKTRCEQIETYVRQAREAAP